MTTTAKRPTKKRVKAANSESAPVPVVSAETSEKMPDILPVQPRRRGRPKGSGAFQKIDEVIKMRAAGYSYHAIAAHFGIHPNFVGVILTNARKNGVQMDDLKLGRFVAAVNSRQERAVRFLNLWEPDPSALTLDITGKQPMRFTGYLLREASSEFIDTLPEKPNRDFWVVRIFKATDRDDLPDQFVVAYSYTTRMKKIPQSICWAAFTADPAAVIETYNPLDHLRGFPPLPQFENSQRQLEYKVTQQYAKLVSEILRDPIEV